MSEKTKKFVGWGMAIERDGQKRIVVVPALRKFDAIDMFKSFGLEVVSEKHIRRVCIVQYPGPKDVQRLKTQSWDKCEIIEDKDNG